ncbi:MAG: hypothetical protein QXU54_00095 [Candidatus Micrarchaeia archaeon]
MAYVAEKQDRSAEEKASNLISESNLINEFLYSVQNGIAKISAIIAEERERREALKRLDNALERRLNELDKLYAQAGPSLGSDIRRAIKDIEDIYAVGLSEIEKASAGGLPADQKIASFKEIVSAAEVAMQARADILRERIKKT